MNQIKIILLTFCCIATILSFSSCGTEIPAGTVGMIQTPNGLQKELVEPGRRWVGPRSTLYLVETAEITYTEDLSILCADDLNFKFELVTRCRLRSADADGIFKVLSAQGTRAEEKGMNKFLKLDVLYDTYVKHTSKSIARDVVSKYQTTQIRDNREEIQKSIQIKLSKAMEGTPIEIQTVRANNFDYPDMITRAQEQKKEYEIKKEQEAARLELELLEVENNIKIAEAKKKERTANAQADAVYMKILSPHITSSYLTLRRIEAQENLYERISNSDKVILDTDAPLMIGK